MCRPSDFALVFSTEQYTARVHPQLRFSGLLCMARYYYDDDDCHCHLCYCDSIGVLALLFVRRKRYAVHEGQMRTVDRWIDGDDIKR